MKQSPSPCRLLLLVDDPVVQGLVETILCRPDFVVFPFRDVGDALSQLRSLDTDLAIIDISSRKSGGVEIIESFRAINREIPIIALSVHDSVDVVVKAMKSGADDFISKPFDANELKIRIQKVLDRKALSREVSSKRAQMKEYALYDLIFGCSRTMVPIRSIVDQVAETDVPIMLRGESGTGKDLLAKVIYAHSLRSQAAFVKVNCSTIPLELVESELFGYEKGAFTGAVERKIGKFEAASGGTIYLDEIGEINPVLQSKLLQVLQDGSFSPLGSDRDIQADMRVISATNLDLEQAVENGRFRRDLYYRLKVVEIFLPPLRDRLEDIPHIAEYFLDQFSRQYNRKTMGLSRRLLRLLFSYQWPGNVRELENMIKRIVIFGDEAPAISEISAKKRVGRGHKIAPVDDDMVQELKVFEKEAARRAERLIIEKVLAKTGWNRVKTAEYLKISYKTLLTKIKECGLHPDGTPQP
ncbi:MAG: sigma-54-dependent Fis family transcriptional regulator [Deltaproteobacteria bacterium]|nr:sigma-54-dependent Fis family transcriptional regulator [Candidatus Anaeroferrophillus wilburensis]MBN2888464.1 sigma-54-dependent Fis family transcriptional regulator [Deltaproteobacteria bacterium]